MSFGDNGIKADTIGDDVPLFRTRPVSSMTPVEDVGHHLQCNPVL